MKTLLLALSLSLLALPIAAQTVCPVEPPHDDCPPGAVRNPPVSPLDEPYMEAAFRASFRGLFGRDPSMVAGAQKDDGCYYVRASNHYGPLGDGQCHAGWSAYWETWLETGHGDLNLAQTPARFQPSVAPPPPPPPPVGPVCDLAPISAQLQVYAATLARIDTTTQAIKDDTASVRSSVTNALVWLAKYGAPVLAAFEACHISGKC